ncbi:MAG: hypothetical protein EHM93_08870 [Bacteroidales bacterium]|nr:MAG: hypothetical protein EHM93_08870 [Bacteroidales bacterium]
MAQFIKNVKGTNLIEFDNGGFDSWCVYLTRTNCTKYAPKDLEYFTILQELGIIYGRERLYSDFVEFYNLTNAHIESNVLNLITSISEKYQEHSEQIDIWFTVIYSGMVAEENKLNAKLKKRIKRLGMHQLLIEGVTPQIAATFSKGKKWWELDKLMILKGF